MEKLAAKAVKWLGEEKTVAEQLLKKKKISSIGLNMKKDIDELMAKLARTVCFFLLHFQSILISSFINMIWFF